MTQIKLDISCELSAGRQFTCYIKLYFVSKSRKMTKNLRYAEIVIGNLY